MSRQGLLCCGCQRLLWSGVCSLVVEVEHARTTAEIWGEEVGLASPLRQEPWSTSLLECPLGSTLWCHLKPVMAGSQRTLFGALPSAPASIVGMPATICVPQVLCLHAATSAEPLKPGTRTTAVVYVGPPRNHGGRPDLSLLSLARAQALGPDLSQLRGTCNPLGCPVGAEFTNWWDGLPSWCEGGA